ncbi:hypothetical protein ACFL1Z_02015 [Thermodesulfobacteriota bacterium]
MNIEGDVVLIHYQDQPTIYARIESIEPDIKKNWYQVTFLLLSIPSQTVTWILREEYFNGASFTMGGVPMLIKGVEPAPQTKIPESPRPSSKKNVSKSKKVIPFKTD